MVVADQQLTELARAVKRHCDHRGIFNDINLLEEETEVLKLQVVRTLARLRIIPGVPSLKAEFNGLISWFTADRFRLFR